MKNIIIRIFTIFLASAIFFSCSKEKLYVGKSSETISTSKIGPEYSYGGISGRLVPVPYYSVLKIYNDEQNFGMAYWPDNEGNFKIWGLVPGTYRIMVIYNVQSSPPEQEYRYFEIREIRVEPQMLTELGDVVLPK